MAYSRGIDNKQAPSYRVECGGQQSFLARSDSFDPEDSLDYELTLDRTLDETQTQDLASIGAQHAPLNAGFADYRFGTRSDASVRPEQPASASATESGDAHTINPAPVSENMGSTPPSISVDDTFTRLPPEIRLSIYKFALAEDTTAIIQPSIDDLLCTHRTADISEAIVITSASGFHRACKYSRSEYHPVFKQRALNLDVGSITAHVVDFDFSALLEGFLGSISRRSRCKLGNEIPFTIKLKFTDNFDPNKAGAGRWFKWCMDQFDPDATLEALLSRRPPPAFNPTYFVQEIESVQLQEAVASYLNLFAHEMPVQHTQIARAVRTYIERNSTERYDTSMAPLEGSLDDQPEFVGWMPEGYYDRHGKKKLAKKGRKSRKRA